MISKYKHAENTHSADHLFTQKHLFSVKGTVWLKFVGEGQRQNVELLLLFDTL